MDMNRETIELMLQEGIKVQMQTWRSPISELYSNRSKGQPLFERSLDPSFYSYDSDAERAKVTKNKMSATNEQQKLAIDVMDLITYACKRYNGNGKAIMRGIIMLRIMNLDTPSFGYGEIAKCLRGMNIKIGKTTIRRRYMTAIDDLIHFYKTK